MSDRKRKEKAQESSAKRQKPNEKFFDSELLITEEDLESRRKRRGAVKDDVYESDDQVQDSDISEQEENDIFEDKKQIEGQEWTKVEDTDKFVAFNLDKELEDGEFDAQGNYILKKKDEMDIHDSWLNGTTRTDMERVLLLIRPRRLMICWKHEGRLPIHCRQLTIQMFSGKVFWST
jgi:hypothetical protein